MKYHALTLLKMANQVLYLETRNVVSRETINFHAFHEQFFSFRYLKHGIAARTFEFLSDKLRRQKCEIV